MPEQAFERRTFCMQGDKPICYYHKAITHPGFLSLSWSGGAGFNLRVQTDDYGWWEENGDDAEELCRRFLESLE